MNFSTAPSCVVHFNVVSVSLSDHEVRNAIYVFTQANFHSIIHAGQNTPCAAIGDRALLG